MKLLSLIEMTVSGGALILAVMLVRALVLDKLPKRAFLVLWALAAARLLVPVGVPSALSVWTLAEEPLRQEAVEILPRENLVWMEPNAITAPENPDPAPVPPALPAVPDAQPPVETEKLDFPVWTAVWLTGLCLCAGFYLLTYLRCRRAFREAVPVEDEAVDRYLAERPLRRRVQVRQWGRETGPMTYGILRPVILLPKNTDWSDTERLRYVLEHELVHIRRLDGLNKLVLAAAACVHWFNPLSWAMLALAGRDIELSCDEAVVRRCGLDRRSAYAMTLIDLEEQKSGLGPFASAFSRNNMEERIRSIMKLKKTSLLAVMLAVVLVCALGTVFATSAIEKSAPPRPRVVEGSFTDAELDRLAGLWFEGYETMTIAEYQEKMWQERDNPEDMELIERYGLNKAEAVFTDGPEATEEANAFDDYMEYVYEPLTSELWQRRNFPDANAEAYWTYTLTILDRDMRVASYEALRGRLKERLSDTVSKEQADAVAAGFSNDKLKVEIPFYARFEDVEHGGGNELYIRSSNEAAEKPDLRSSLTVIPSENYTEEESRKLFSLWFKGYEEMTVTKFREKMRSERTDADMELIERFSLDGYAYELPAGKEADALEAFNDYFFTVYEPLTADYWEIWCFDGSGADGMQYQCDLTVLDGDALTVGKYEELRYKAEALLRQSSGGDEDASAAAALSTPALRVEARFYSGTDDAFLREASSNESAAAWDRVLAPYLGLGLTYTFNDPDHDGNGLTMWFEGKEVRGIFDEKEGVWISEHIGNGFSDGAVELYTVYTGGALTGLRPATPEEQAEYDGIRDRNTASLQNGGEEEREFLNATRADYDGILALRTADYAGQSLADFNQRLLDWGNENADAWDRINCDVIWDDYAVELTEEEKAFVSLTCRLSGTENGQKIRALYTGGEAADPGFSAQLPTLQHVEDSVTTAWCDLYYDLTYHVSDPAAVTVGERDRCVAAMEQAISDFWWATPMDELLGMTEEDIVVRFNAWAADCGTDHVSFCHVTGDHVHYECADERGYHDEVHHAEEHHSGHHS